MTLVKSAQNMGAEPWSWTRTLMDGLHVLLDTWSAWSSGPGRPWLLTGVGLALSGGAIAALWPRLLRRLQAPAVRQLQQVVASLEQEVGRRRTAEQHAADVEETLALTLASIDAGFIAADRAGCVTRMNATAERLTGWPQAEAVGRPVMQVFVREGLAATLAARNPVELLIEQQLGIDSAEHLQLSTRGGTAVPVELKAALTHHEDGSVRGLAMVFRDIGRLQRAEADARRLAAIVQSSHDAIVGKTLDGRITSWNAAAQALFGWSADEAIGQPVQMLIPPERIDEEMRILADLAHGRVVPPFDTQRRAKDGRLVEVSVTISPIRDGAGRIVGGSKIARDNTLAQQVAQARRRAEQLEVENRQMQLASRTKSQFLANMSHELRTPLNAVIGFADLLHSGAVPTASPKHREFLGHIGASGRHLLQLINDVLDLAKVESGRFEFHPEPLQLQPLVAEVCTLLQATVAQKRLDLRAEVDTTLGELQLDPLRLKQVLYNYLSNAIKFTPEGGQVHLRASAEGADWLRIEVEDSGIGIAAQDIPRLFVEFHQLDAGYDKRHAGTGLGLALTRRLVHAQGGSVGARSTPGRGSVFHLLLPRRHPRLPDAGKSPLPHVLVIDDDVEEQVRWRQALAVPGYIADPATTAEQARQQVGQRPYAGITLDMQLAGQPGLAALAAIREGGGQPESPVVGMTMPVGPAGTASFAVADILGKPLRSEQVLAAMARLAPPPGRPLRVLVIDDEPAALALMGAVLAAAGIEAVGLQDGRQALRELDHHRPDAIVLDLMMPGFDGFAVLDALLRLPPWHQTPVFIWTSLLLTDDEYTLLAESARAIVSKGGGGLLQVIQGLRRLSQPAPAGPPP